MSRWAVVLTVIVAAGTAAAGPNAGTIIERSVEANRKDWRAAPQYTFYERDRVKGGTRTYHVMMIEGSPYYRLVAQNGRSLGPAENRREQEKLESTVAARKREGTAERKARIAKYERDRKRDHLMVAQLTKAFDFKLEREEALHGHQVYVLEARPRSGYEPPSIEAKALTGMQGKLWIDKQSYQWVKVEAKVVKPVEIEGFLAQVEPGTRFELENTPVANGIWLPSHYVMRSKARILWVYTHRGQDQETYYGYQPVSGVATPSDH